MLYATAGSVEGNSTGSRGNIDDSPLGCSANLNGVAAGAASGDVEIRAAEALATRLAAAVAVVAGVAVDDVNAGAQATGSGGIAFTVGVVVVVVLAGVLTDVSSAFC